MLLAALLAPTAMTPAATIEIDLERVRNGKGVIQVCLTRERRHFPDCGADPAAIKQSVPASQRRLLLTDVPPGDWAIALFHDENVNRKLDTLLGIPREGFGFSRNPAVRFGAPRYDEVNIKLGAGFSRVSVRMQYVL